MSIESEISIDDTDPRSLERERRAKRYFCDSLRGQREWYSRKASAYKTRSNLISLAIILAGSITGFIGIFSETTPISITTALLGAFVTVAKAWERIARYEENWMGYRIASERMKRERRLFVEGAGTYRDIEDDDEAYRNFVEAVETIIAEEQRIYWSGRGEASQRTDHQAARNEQGDEPSREK